MITLEKSWHEALKDELQKPKREWKEHFPSRG